MSTIVDGQAGITFPDSSNGGTTNNEYIGQWTVDAEL